MHDDPKMNRYPFYYWNAGQMRCIPISFNAFVKTHDFSFTCCDKQKRASWNFDKRDLYICVCKSCFMYV